MGDLPFRCEPILYLPGPAGSQGQQKRSHPIQDCFSVKVNLFAPGGIEFFAQAYVVLSCALPV
jgi:hypothetical protein